METFSLTMKILRKVFTDLCTRSKTTKKKLLKLEQSYGGDFDPYLSTYMTSITLVNGYKFDMLTQKSSNCLFY